MIDMIIADTVIMSIFLDRKTVLCYNFLYEHKKYIED